MFHTLQSLRTGSRSIGTAALLALALAGVGTAAQAQAPLKAIHTFSGTDGAQPGGGLVAGPDGALYGVTDAALNSGDSATTDILYKVRQDGTGFQVLHTFPGTSSGTNSGGSAPNQLLLVNGFLYGTTYTGGANGTGVIFKIDTSGGAFQILHTFSALNAQSQNADGAGATAGLILGPDGALYGTTTTAGTSGGGIVYKINSDGSGFQAVYAFPATTPSARTNATGSQPGTALTYASTGLLYGTTQAGGASGLGTVFKITPAGQSFGTLHSFDNAGGYASLGLIAASDGNLYGTTFVGGSGGSSAGGTLFRLTPGGTYQVLKSFTTGTGQIAIPLTPPTEAPDGTLYGATNGGGTTGLGVIYQVNKDGSNFQAVGNLSNNTGVSPSGPLLITNQKVYETARAGGANSDGTLLALSLLSTSHILWTNTNGAMSLWTVTTGSQFSYYTYGPFSGWKASAVAQTPDGMTHVLWTHSPDGQVSVWDVTAAGVYIHKEYGPFSGWNAVGMSAGSDGRLHLLWNHSPDNQMSLWSLSNAAASYTHAEYGPFAGWTAKAVATGGDGATDIVWTQASGYTSSWKISPTDGSYIHHEYGPFSGWTANALGADSNGQAALIWGNTNGTQSLWNADFAAGTYSYANYGPYPGWSVVSLAPGADGLRRLLWNHAPDGQMSLWNLDSANHFTYNNYGPYPGWSAVSISSNQ